MTAFGRKETPERGVRDDLGHVLGQDMQRHATLQPCKCPAW